MKKDAISSLRLLGISRYGLCVLCEQHELSCGVQKWFENCIDAVLGADADVADGTD